MRDDIILKLQRIIEGNDRITWDLFPAIYDGFLEADELSLAEDRMLQLVASAVQTATNDKIISTASAEKVAEYEDAFGLSASGLTLDERRQQVLDYINRSRVINEETLHELAQSKAPGYTVYEKTDPQALTLGIFTEEDDAQGHLPAVGIVDEIRPTVPQNLALYAGVDTTFDRPIVISHAHFSALWAGLGTVERHVPEITLYYFINKETGEETRGNEEPKNEVLPKGGKMIEGAKAIAMQSYVEPVYTMNKGGKMIEGAKVPLAQRLGTSLYFIISKTPDA